MIEVVLLGEVRPHNPFDALANFWFPVVRVHFLEGQTYFGLCRQMVQALGNPNCINFVFCANITIVQVCNTLEKTGYVVLEYGQSHVHIFPAPNHRVVTFHILFRLGNGCRGVEGS